MMVTVYSLRDIGRQGEVRRDCTGSQVCPEGRKNSKEGMFYRKSCSRRKSKGCWNGLEGEEIGEDHLSGRGSSCIKAASNFTTHLCHPKLQCKDVKAVPEINGLAIIQILFSYAVID